MNMNTIGIMLLTTSVFACQPALTSAEDDQPASAGQIHHTIDYIEFTVTDMAEAKRFYNEAFDWNFNDYGPDYAGIQGKDREIGGFRLDEKAPAGGPLVILYSNDLELTVTRVVEAGGRIVQSPFSFPGGRRFHFEDPSGNELAVWSEK
jgi:predicted enzyme related to lactoylglutathione lyase